MCYVVVFFHEGIAYTYQMNGVCAWSFSHLPKYYSKLEMAKKRAHKIRNTYLCDKVVVFEVDATENFSSCTLKKWYNEDKKRIMYEIVNDSVKMG